MEQQIQALEEQIDIKTYALTTSNRPQQLLNTSRYKPQSSAFASLFPYTDYGSVMKWEISLQNIK